MSGALTTLRDRVGGGTPSPPRKVGGKWRRKSLKTLNSRREMAPAGKGL